MPQLSSKICLKSKSSTILSAVRRTWPRSSTLLSLECLKAPKQANAAVWLFLIKLFLTISKDKRKRNKKLTKIKIKVLMKMMTWSSNKTVTTKTLRMMPVTQLQLPHKLPFLSISSRKELELFQLSYKLTTKDQLSRAPWTKPTSYLSDNKDYTPSNLCWEWCN